MKPEEFGKYLKKLRQDKKMTIRQLDLYSSVSHSYLSQLENGKRGIPTPEILKKLYGPLGVEYEELMMKAGYLEKKETKEKNDNLDDEYRKIERFARKVSSKDREKALNLLKLAFEDAFNEEDEDDDDDL